MCIGCVNRQEKVVLFLYLTGDFTPLWCKTSADPKKPMASRPPKSHGQQTPLQLHQWVMTGRGGAAVAPLEHQHQALTEGNCV